MCSGLSEVADVFDPNLSDNLHRVMNFIESAVKEVADCGYWLLQRFGPTISRWVGSLLVATPVQHASSIPDASIPTFH